MLICWQADRLNSTNIRDTTACYHRVRYVFLVFLRLLTIASTNTSTTISAWERVKVQRGKGLTLLAHLCANGGVGDAERPPHDRTVQPEEISVHPFHLVAAVINVNDTQQ